MSRKDYAKTLIQNGNMVHDDISLSTLVRRKPSNDGGEATAKQEPPVRDKIPARGRSGGS